MWGSKGARIAQKVCLRRWSQWPKPLGPCCPTPSCCYVLLFSQFLCESSTEMAAATKSWACCMRSQIPGPFPTNLPILKAISVEIGWVHARMRCNCWRETPICRAASLTDILSEGSTSSRMISPGWTGGRFKGLFAGYSIILCPQWYCSRSTRRASGFCHSNAIHHGPFTWMLYLLGFPWRPWKSKPGMFKSLNCSVWSKASKSLRERESKSAPTRRLLPFSNSSESPLCLKLRIIDGMYHNVWQCQLLCYRVIGLDADSSFLCA